MMRISRSSPILFLLATALTACDSGGSGPDTIEPVADAPFPFSRDSKSLTDTFAVDIRTLNASGSDTTEFAAGETVYFRMTATNRTDQPQVTTAADGGFPAYCIRQTGAATCAWDTRSIGVFTQATVDTAFGAFEVLEYNGLNEQQSTSGESLPAGEYEIRGVIGSDAQDVLGSPWHQFVIAD